MTCWDIPQHYCYKSAAVLSACPDRCGCANAYFGNIFATVYNGCPALCNELYAYSLNAGIQESVDEGMEGLAQNCVLTRNISMGRRTVQVPVVGRKAMERHMAGVASWRSYVMSVMNSWEDIASNLVQGSCITIGKWSIPEFDFQGCPLTCEFVGLVKFNLGLDLCHPPERFRSVKPWCAEECGCSDPASLRKRECPISCVP
mmetsp:Transcript_133843/g.231461  ORF Transcript_133843/g.231461 Transcript_133843/m.231461 type:complete len:202 (-) Transcript_133843:63-668(-)